MQKEISGSEFNRIYKDVKFYKFLNDDLIHYGFKYHLGLNVDTIPFNPKKSCSKGGLYFCQDIHCHKYYMQYGQYIASIEIPDDARVYAEKCKFKTDKLIIKSITNFYDISDEFWAIIDSKYLDTTHIGSNHIKKQITEMYSLSVQRDGLALQFVENVFLTEDICILAVQQNGLALMYVPEHLLTKEICSEAVRQNGLAIQYVTETSCLLNDEICSQAVEQNGLALKYVKDQTEEICELAVQQNGYAIEFVKEQTEEICKLAMQQYVKNDATCILAVKCVQQMNNLIQYIYNTTIQQFISQ